MASDAAQPLTWRRRLVRAGREGRCALVAGSAVFPGLAAAATLVIYLAGWPFAGNGPAQFGVGLALGATAWLLLSVLFFRPLTRPESASPGIHGELAVMVASLYDELSHLRTEPDRHGGAARADDRGTLAQVESRLDTLTREMALGDRPAGPDERPAGSCLEWLLGYGYVNAWRRVHRAEEALLELESTEAVYLAAITDLARLRASSIEGGDVLAARLAALLEEEVGIRGNRTGGPGPAAEAAASTAGRRDGETEDGDEEAEDDGRARRLLSGLDPPLARALVRQCRYVLNRHRNGLWEQLVHLRNRLFATMVVTGIVVYAILALAVVVEADAAAMTAAVAFYLVGASVGLFGELYTSSRRRSGVVSDSGLGMVRLLTVPLLSGIAAVGGVVLTRLAGAATGELPPLDEVLSLSEYPAGLVVAAAFGLTPGLFLERLRDQSQRYTEELARSGVGSERQAERDGGPSS